MLSVLGKVISRKVKTLIWVAIRLLLTELIAKTELSCNFGHSCYVSFRCNVGSVIMLQLCRYVTVVLKISYQIQLIITLIY